MSKSRLYFNKAYLRESYLHDSYFKFILQLHDYFIDLPEPPTNKTEKQAKKEQNEHIKNSNWYKHSKLKVKDYDTIISKHGLLRGGNKQDKQYRTYSYLTLSPHAIIIQKRVRGWIQRHRNSLHGPACLKRSLCNNQMDFLDFKPISSIPLKSFFSFRDEDGFIYGFHVEAFYSLLIDALTKRIALKNPYNRKYISDDVVRSLICLRSVLKSF